MLNELSENDKILSIAEFLEFYEGPIRISLDSGRPFSQYSPCLTLLDKNWPAQRPVIYTAL